MNVTERVLPHLTQKVMLYEVFSSDGHPNTTVLLLKPHLVFNHMPIYVASHVQLLVHLTYALPTRLLRAQGLGLILKSGQLVRCKNTGCGTKRSQLQNPALPPASSETMPEASSCPPQNPFSPSSIVIEPLDFSWAHGH